MERALLVTVDFCQRERWTPAERSAELRELARSVGATVVREEIVRRHEPAPSQFIGSGKAEELARICADERINLVIFNNDLNGTQQKHLEEVINVRTIDRTQLILDIFAKRAHSNEGKLQVELAQLLYLMPRLVGKGIELSSQTGGIGAVGPGEKKLEVDRRKIRDRISRLEKDLEELSQRRAMMRKKRGRFSALTIAIVGYTNAGKSTLLNALTNSTVLTQDKLFATLDPTVRKFILPNRQKALFVDTVGFLDKLPHHLIEAFKATLEEVVEADLILHLVDVSHPKAPEQSDAVYKVLEEIGVKDVPMITVLNKADLVSDPVVLQRAKTFFNSTVAISALKKEGFDDLINAILPHISGLMAVVRMTIPSSDAKTLNLIYENGLVTKKEYSGDSVYIEAQVPLRIKELLESREPTS